MALDSKDTLLGVVLDSLTEGQISGSTICRLHVVCSFRKRQNNAEQTHELLSAALRQQPGADAVTGLLVLYPACLLLCLEGPLSTLQGVLRELSIQNAVNILQETRVLSSMEGLPARCCNGLHTAYIPSASRMDSAEAADPAQVVKLTSSVVAVARGVAECLSVLPEAELKRQLASLASYHEDLPAPEVLLSLVSCTQLPTGCEWLAMFSGTAPDMPLDQELVWPVAPLISAV